MFTLLLQARRWDPFREWKGAVLHGVGVGEFALGG